MRRALYLDDLAVGGKFATGTVTLTLEGCKAFAAEFGGAQTAQGCHVFPLSGGDHVEVKITHSSDSTVMVPDNGGWSWLNISELR